MHNLIVRHKSFINTITQLNLSHTFFGKLAPKPIDLPLINTYPFSYREWVSIEFLMGNQQIILLNTQNYALLDL